MKRECFKGKKTILYAEGLVTLDEVLQSISRFVEGR